MGLYDNYRLANSQQVEQYHGSVVPEMVAVSQELQKRYDTSQNNMDYTTQYLNSLSALPQDQNALGEVRKKYQDSLANIGQRKDLENATRETTMLAQQLPQDYAGFAQRQKDFSERKAELDKKVSEGKLSPEESQALLQRDIHLDRGIQKDPATGRYTGRFQGQEFTDTYDMRKGVDDIMDKQFPQSQGWTKEVAGFGDGEKWIFKNGSKTVTLGPDRIKQIISTGLQNDPHAQSWIEQQKNLGTYNLDYSKISPEQISKLPQPIQDRLAKGESLTNIIKTAKASGIHKDILEKAHAYAVSKYVRNDKETESTIKENPYTLKTHELSAIPISDDILQPKFGVNLDSPDAIRGKVDELSSYIGQKEQDYNQWLQQNKVKVIGDPNSPNAKWIDPVKGDVTASARQYLAEKEQAKTNLSQVKAYDADIARKTGWDKVPQSVKDAAEKAYQKAYREISNSQQALNGLLTEADYQRVAMNAKNAILQNTPAYKRYAQALNQNTEAQSVHANLQRFQGKNADKLNEEVEHHFNTTATNLDPNGSKYGTQGLEWGSGKDAGKPLTNDDYSKVIGKGKYVGHGVVNGKLMDFFNVGVEKTDKNGKLMETPIIVRKPAYTGVLENMIKNGETSQAHVVLTQELNQADGTYGRPVQIPIGNGKQITFKKVNNSDRTNNWEHQNSQYILSVPTSTGVKNFPVNNIEEAVSNILQNMR
jgi:hypothetical protein